MSLTAIKRIGLLHRDKENPYLLVTISGDPITYGDGIIRIEIGLVEVEIEGRRVSISFDILLLGKNEAVLGMLFFREFNPRIDWITGQVEIWDTRRR